MQTHRVFKSLALTGALVSLVVLAQGSFSSRERPDSQDASYDTRAPQNAQATLEEGRRIFRYDTFGDEAWWGDTLQLQKAIEGERLGGVGAGVSPRGPLVRSA